MADSRQWVWLGVVAAASFFVYLLHPILTPFLTAIVLAYISDPIVDRLEKFGFPRTWGTVTVFSVFTVILMVLFLVLMPLLATQFMKLYQLVPQVLDWLQHTAMPWAQTKLGLDDSFWNFDKIKVTLSEHMGQAGDILGVVLSQATASSLALAGFLANLVLIPVVAFYLLRDWNIMLAAICRLLPHDREKGIVSLAKECHDVLGAFVRGQLLVMLALGVIYSVGLMLVGLELDLLIGLMSGLAAIVPYMGFIFGIGAALTAGLFQFGGDLYPMLGIITVFMAGQALEGMVLTPLLVGERIGLHPVAVIFAILAGGELFGFTGVLLALPIAAVIMILLRHIHEIYKNSQVYKGDEDPRL